MIFASEAKKAGILEWCERFRRRIPVPVEDVTVQTSFGRTHALVCGPPDAPPLVLLHGALASSAHVLPELGPLLHTRRVYALDVIGQSVWSEDRRIDVSGDDYGKWVLEACTALGLDTFDLFGVSWGGFVATRAAILGKDRIRHLTLMMPAGIVGNSIWASMRDAGLAILLYRMFPSAARLDRVVRSQFTTLDPDWSAYFGEALFAYKLDIRLPPMLTPQDAARVRCPVLVFGAENDASFPGRALLARAKQLFPHARTELIANSKHCPPLTDEFREWMASCVSRALLPDRLSEGENDPTRMADRATP
jgi:pimeloyl-ACP methyl ester carboxylesterase